MASSKERLIQLMKEVPEDTCESFLDGFSNTNLSLAGVLNYVAANMHVAGDEDDDCEDDEDDEYAPVEKANNVDATIAALKAQ